MIRAAEAANGQIYPAFPLGGDVSSVVVGADWVEIIPGEPIDLILIRVPSAAPVILRSSAEPLSGVPTPDEVATSWPLDAGIHAFSTDRRNTTRFYCAIDPAASGETTIKIMRAATR